jgi:hypothetical protein
MNCQFLRILIILASMSLVSVAADKTAPAALEASVDKALKAYNAGDWKAFFADYAQAMSALANEQTFKALYESAAKPQFGNYVSRTLVAGESVTTGETPLQGEIQQGGGETERQFHQGRQRAKDHATAH